MYGVVSNNHNSHDYETAWSGDLGTLTGMLQCIL